MNDSFNNNFNTFKSYPNSSRKTRADSLNSKIVNNYEIVEYEKSSTDTTLRKEPILNDFQQQQASYNANTFDLYSYNDNSIIYQDEIYHKNDENDQPPSFLPASPLTTQFRPLPPAPIQAVAHQISPCETPTIMLNAPQLAEHNYLECKNLSNQYVQIRQLSSFENQINNQTEPNIHTLDISDRNINENNSRIQKKIYESANTLNVKYLIDINDLKAHLNSVSVGTNLNTLVACSKADLIQNGGQNDQCDDDDTLPIKNGKSTRNKSKKKDKKKMREKRPNNCLRFFQYLFCCFAKPLYYTLFGLWKCIKCLFACFFKPCCNTASVLAVLFAFIGLMIGIVCMNAMGLIKLPQELTNNICNATYERNNFLYTFNNTIIREVEKNRSSESIDQKIERNTNHTRNGTFSNQTIDLKASISNLNQTIEAQKELMKKFTLLNLRKSLNSNLKALNSFRNRISKFIPLQYDIELRPFQAKQNIETRIKLSIKLYCNLSTNVLLLKTKEFLNIELNLISLNKSLAENGIKKWNYELSTNILEIETKNVCTKSNYYLLSVHVQYKNYGTRFSYDKALKDMKNVYLLGFGNSARLDAPFPVIVDSFDINTQTGKYITVLGGPSVFNLTLVRPKNTFRSLIFNTDVSNKFDEENFEHLTYKPTPMIQVQTLGLIMGDFICIESYHIEKSSINIKICSTSPKDVYGENFDLISIYAKLLIKFYTSYANKSYEMNKLDVVILPTDFIMDLLNTNDFQMINMGLIYLPASYLNQIDSNDQLTKIQNKLKILNLISKQLAKQWFFRAFDLNCEKNFINLAENANSNITPDIVNEANQLLRSYFENSPSNKTDEKYYGDRKIIKENSVEKILNSYLEMNEKCFLYKGFINWISYLAFQSVQPDLFDLVNLEWSLIKEIDETYFLVDQNLNHIYQSYEFPRLVESDRFQSIKTEMKSLISVRALYLIIGKEKFQNIVQDLFRTRRSSLNLKSTTITDRTQLDLYLNEVDSKRSCSSILKAIEQYSNQYSLMPFDEVTLKEIIRSWILADNEIIVNLNRNYNKKETTICLDSFKNQNIRSFYYPLSLFYGNIKSKTFSIDLKSNQENNNLVWLNQTNYELKFQPGANKLLIANYMQTFSLLKINYDKQNWEMIIQQFLYDYKTLSVNLRAQIIDDVFNLINNQALSINFGLKLIEYLPNEDNYLPWKFAIEHLRKIIKHAEDDSQIYSKFREFLIELVKPVYHRLKWGESSLDTFDEKLVRILVVDLLCSLDYEDCVENSVKQLSDSIKINVYNIPQYLSKSIYCTAIRYSGINEWNYLWIYYSKQTDNSDLKDSLLYSLSCTSQTWILNLLFRKLVYENSISAQDLPKAFEYISRNPIGKYVIWNHISQNYQNFYNKAFLHQKKRIGNDPELFLKIFQVSTKEFRFKYEIEQIHSFIDEIGLKNISNAYLTTRENQNKENSLKQDLFSHINSRIIKYATWKAANIKELDDWLTKMLSKSRYK